MAGGRAPNVGTLQLSWARWLPISDVTGRNPDAYPGVITHCMKLIALLCLLAAVSLCGCAYGLGSGAVPPAPAPAPVAVTESTVPQPTISVAPALNVSPVPRNSANPIIGTWEWTGENNTTVVYSFMPDGTFIREDQGTGMGMATGTWLDEGGGSYKLIYDNPGYVPEHIRYYHNAGQLGNRSSYLSRA